LRAETGAQVSLEKSGKGDFEVLRDDRPIHSKRHTGRIPSADQVLTLLREA